LSDPFSDFRRVSSVFGRAAVKILERCRLPTTRRATLKTEAIVRLPMTMLIDGTTVLFDGHWVDVISTDLNDENTNGLY
jgi:hypothetical protein